MQNRTCAFAEVLYQGGSVAPMMSAECQAKLAQERSVRWQSLAATLRSQGRVAALAPVSRAVNANLNKFYALFLQQLKTSLAARRALIASETAWIAYRDRACAIEGGECLTDLERERIVDLQGTWLGEVFW